MKKAVALLRQCVKDSITQLQFVAQALTQTDEKDLNYCLYHQKKGDALERYVMFERISEKNLQDREIILQNTGARNVHERPFLNYGNNQGKEQAIRVSALERSIEATTMQTEGDSDLKMAQQVKNLFKFKHQMDFNPKQKLAITKSIIEFTDLLESYDLFGNRSRRNNRFEDGSYPMTTSGVTFQAPTINPCTSPLM